jgi:hypothetical protein
MSPTAIALKEISTEPACAATLSTNALTAASSSASTTAEAVLPPFAWMSAAVASSVAGVRPARKTLAPSRANARATAPPITPPPP